MDAKKELDGVMKMLKGGGFDVVDVQFEGIVEAMDKRVVAVINKMSESGQAMGVLRVYYQAEGQDRMIEIPVGNPPAQEAPQEELPPQ